MVQPARFKSRLSQSQHRRPKHPPQSWIKLHKNKAKQQMVLKIASKEHSDPTIANWGVKDNYRRLCARFEK